ncbi:outer arm dynein light chain 1 [Gonapodya prolifera JEL478]|uniref:Outer arm dynein light chain 1 n=1 Tax=Gonapodya prolifera (strain JEL478) TaxID=1344416 RepID=A0A138ZXM8_GONPJ|nr:outer arm dynein light chain 1 [Gonapodya prolifera JEL478]|eukprot:KXS09247.1 outer arm dynein light chain 1 [Gonapodya prolifera JEL478]
MLTNAGNPSGAGTSRPTWRFRDYKQTGEKGQTLITPQYLKQLCREQKLYSTPALNDKLYLHYKGFTKIEHLDEYTGLKALWMEGNGITKIEGFDQLTELRCLYLHQNVIERMENLNTLVNLDSLSLGNNLIHKIEGVGRLTNLKTLQLPSNHLKTADDLRGVLECPTISILDLSHNRIEDPAIADILFQMPNLTVLNLQGNPIIRQMENYRRRLIAGCPKLTYLDDRPVFDSERKQVEAWARGGLEAEREERQRQRDEERAEHQRNFDALLRIQREAVERRRARGEDVDSDPRYDSPHLRRLHAEMLSQIETDDATAGGDDNDGNEEEEDGEGEVGVRQRNRVESTDGSESDSGTSTAAESEGSRRSRQSGRSLNTAVGAESEVPVRRFREVDVTGRLVTGHDDDAEGDTASEADSERSGATIRDEGMPSVGRRVLIQEIGSAIEDNEESEPRNAGELHSSQNENDQGTEDVPPLEDASDVVEAMRRVTLEHDDVDEETGADRVAREIRTGTSQRRPIIEEL